MRTLIFLALIAGPLLAQEEHPEAVVRDAVKEIAAVEQAAERLESGDKNTANRLLRRLKIVLNKLEGAKDKQHAAWADAAKRYNELQTRIVATANSEKPQTGPPEELVKLNDEVTAAFEEMKKLPMEAMDGAEVVATWRARIAAFRKRLAAFPAEDRNTKLVAGNVDAIATTLDKGLEMRRDAVRSADAGERLQALKDKYLAKNLPEALEDPLEPQRVQTWVLRMRRILDVELPADLARIEEIGKELGPRSQPVSSARHWVGGNGKRLLDERLLSGRQLVDAKVVEGLRMADWILSTDPENQHHVLNRLLAEGTFAENMEALRKGLHGVALAEAFDAASKEDTKARRRAEREKVESAIAHLRSCAETALDKVRMPEPTSKDEELLAAAASALEKQGGAAGWKRMVVSYGPHRFEKREGTATVETDVIRVLTYHYVWDEFQVTTAEKGADGWWLWASRMKRYEKGDPKTPIGRWVLTDRFKTTKILEANIGG